MKSIGIAGVLIGETDEFGHALTATTKGNFDTTTLTYAAGCRMVDSSTGKTYRNSGTAAAPVWNEDSLVTSDEISPLVQQVVQVSLSAAQINGMYAASVEIVPAIAGKAIILDDMILDLIGTATQFAGGGVVNLQYKNTVNGAGTTLHADIAAAVVTGATARVVTQRIAKDLSATATADIVGIGVFIGNKSGAFTTGTGVAIVTCRFHTI